MSCHFWTLYVIYNLAPSGPFDVARTTCIFKPYHCTISHMRARRQERVAVRYIPARSCPCRCVGLEPGYKSLITPRLRDMAGVCALRSRALRRARALEGVL